MHGPDTLASYFEPAVCVGDTYESLVANGGQAAGCFNLVMADVPLAPAPPVGARARRRGSNKKRQQVSARLCPLCPLKHERATIQSSAVSPFHPMRCPSVCVCVCVCVRV